MADTATMAWTEEELERSIYRESFEEFVRSFWCEVPGSGILKWNWHLSLFCEELQRIAERVFAGLPKEYDFCLNVSPGTSKSTVWSILFPAWCWTRMPSCRFLTASHTDELALDLANKSRNVIKSEKYSKLFPEIEFRLDQDSKGYFANTLGGDRKTCTVAGKSPIGFHGHILICDDLLDPKKVLSEVECRTAKDFITNVLPSRKVDKRVSVTLLIMQRLGVEDPTDVMLKEAEKEGADPVRHICLPAELTKGDDGAYLETDVKPQELARRYVDGLMDNNRLDRQALASFKARGALYYATQFLQKPYARSGGLFYDEYFNQRVKSSPYHAKRIRYWDRAASSEGSGNCRTAGVLISRDDESGNFYIEHVVVGEWEPHKRNQKMLATALRDRAKYGPKDDPTIWIEAEGGSSGKDAFKAIAKVLMGFNVRQQYVTRMGNKVTRAEPWSAQLAARNVYVVDNGESISSGKAEWNIEDYVKEHLSFPNGRLKDQVDASSGAFNLLSGGNMKKGLKTYTLGSTKHKGLRIVATSVDQLPLLDIAEHPCLLIHLHNPSLLSDPVPIPDHALRKLVDTLQLQFLDIDPADFQEKWGIPLEPYDMTVEQLMMKPEQGKALWNRILRKKDPPVEVIVIVDQGDNRAVSIALAVCDVLSLDRSSTIYFPEEPDKKFTKADKPLNQFVFDVTKLSRNSVM